MSDIIIQLEEVSAEIGTTEANLGDLKRKRDELVSAARDERVPYAAISAATGMSVSWINASLVRTDGYRPRAGRPRRRE